jgi:alkanesulfonate monooxygenase SsuD/methylene tetrahydromethanopterin reductase-like flavin-dependent oxidoreductase (luciferase family)
MSRGQFEQMRTLRGAYAIGSPQEVVEKILFQHEIFGHDRVMLQFTVGGSPHEGILRSIELLGREVAPAVRARITERASGE